MNIMKKDLKKIIKFLRELKFYKEGFLDKESIIEAKEINNLIEKYNKVPYRCSQCGISHYRGKLYYNHLQYRDKHLSISKLIL